MRLRNVSIKWELMALCIFLVAVPVIILGIFSYNQVKQESALQVQNGLKSNVAIMYGDIETVLKTTAGENRSREQTVLLQEMLNHYAKTTVGKTGYLYVLDEKGSYILSLRRESDGKNLYQVQDANGNYFIQDMINGAKALPDGRPGLMSYQWKNTGETAVREKIAAFVYVDDLGWTIGSSAYIDDFMDGVIRTRNLTIIICIIAILVGSLLAYAIASALARRVQELSIKMKTVANGDLTISADNLSAASSEFFDLNNNFQAMTDSLKLLITRIHQNANTAAASAEELSASAEEVNASVEQVSSTIQEIAKGAQNLSKNAAEAASRSKMTEESAKRGSDAANSVQHQMDIISGTTKESAVKIGGLSDKSQKIGNIIETINSISEQTNLLALNAAIEAARAGDAGRGFAVVADEVRKLAEESKKATGLIRELIGTIQDEVNNSVSSMQLNTKQVDTGAKSVIEALAAFEEVPILINQASKSIMEISAVAQENAAGAEEVSASVEEVTSAIQQVATTAQQLSASANELKQLVNQFKLNDATQAAAKTVR